MFMLLAPTLQQNVQQIQIHNNQQFNEALECLAVTLWCPCIVFVRIAMINTVSGQYLRLLYSSHLSSLLLFSPPQPSSVHRRLSIPRPALLFESLPLPHSRESPPPLPSLLHYQRTKESVSDTTHWISFTQQPPPHFQMGLAFFQGFLATPRVLQNGCHFPSPQNPLLSCPSSTCSPTTCPCPEHAPSPPPPLYLSLSAWRGRGGSH